MLSEERNRVLTQTGSGTPMGELMRRYWQPAALSRELPENDGPPLRVRLLGEDLIAFAQGEAIHTEDSHKYTLESFKSLAGEAGYVPGAVWTDAAQLFSVQWLQAH